MSVRAIFRPLCLLVGHGWEMWSEQRPKDKYGREWGPYWKVFRTYWKCFRCGLRSDTKPEGW